MSLLITLNDIKARKPISVNANEAMQLNEHIQEAQDFDLRPILGDEFYFLLVEESNESPQYPTLSDLWNGCTYEVGGITYTHEGIKAYLVYSAYARYSANASTVATATGFVHKNNQFSEPVSEKTISRKVEQARSGAQVYENRFRHYLDNNRDLYPLWKQTCRNEKKYTAGVKIRQIG